MTLEDLKIFLAVCEAESFSAVARAQGCTQPAVSQHVSRLEKEFGVPLLERRSRGVAVTEAGKVLYEGALEGLDAISIAVRQIEQLREGERGSLSIATGGTTVKHFMQEAIVEFRSRNPKISLNFQSANSLRRCVEALRVEKADLAFITMRDHIRGIEQRPVAKMPWVLVVKSEDPLAKRKRLKIKELANIPYITLPPRSTSQVQLEEAMLTEGLRLESSTMVDDWDTAIMLVELGLGYAITPARHGQNFARFRRVAAIPIVDLAPVTFGWAVRRWKSLSQAALDWVDIFKETMSKVSDIQGFEIED
jgi:DNA-binding transcriptional LysR family regulator